MSDEGKCTGVKANNLVCPLRDKCENYLMPAQEYQWYNEACFVNDTCERFFENPKFKQSKKNKKQEV